MQKKMSMTKLTNKSLNKVSCSIFIVIGAFLIFLLSYDFRFLVADDYLINYIINGNYGTGYNQISNPYLNGILMLLISTLKNIMPIFNWYYIYLFTSLLISFIILHVIMFKNKLPYYSHIFLIISQILLSITITYTIIAYLLIFTGSILFLKSENKKEEILSIILFILGNLTRDDVTITAIVLIVPIMLFEYIKNKNKKVIKLIMLLISIFIFANISNALINSSNEIQKEYIKWNKDSTNIRDFLKINYENFEESFKKINFSENDLNCFYSWMFSNKELYSSETLQTISSFTTFSQRYSLNPIFWIIMFFINKFYLLYLLLIIFFIFTNKNKNKYFYLLIFSGLIELIALATRKRFVLRVILPIIFINICCILLYENKIYIKKSFKKLTNLIAPIVLVLSSIFILLQHNEILFPKSIDTGNVYDYIKENEDTLFICDEFNTEININKQNLILDQNNKLNNLISLGNWSTFSVQYYYILDKYNVKNKDNLYDAIVYEDINFISYNEIERNYFKTYLKEHYNNYILNEIYNEGNVIIYSVKKGEN